MAVSMVLWAVIALLGASIGSFLTLVTYRLPREEAIGLSRSRCPSCGATLTVRDLVPVLSWLFSRGRCRHCHTRVSARYPLTEFFCALGTVATVWWYGLTLEALAVAGLWWCIVAIVVTDLEHYIILDEVQLALIFFGALYHYALGTEVVDVLGAAVMGLGIGLALKYGFLYLRNKDGLGMGDVKLLFGVGIWLASSMNFVPFLFFSGVLGVLCGTLWRVVGRGQLFPFGPALAASLLICVVWPAAANQFWQLYGAVPTH